LVERLELLLEQLPDERFQLLEVDFVEVLHSMLGLQSFLHLLLLWDLLEPAFLVEESQKEGEVIFVEDLLAVEVQHFKQVFKEFSNSFLLHQERL